MDFMEKAKIRLDHWISHNDSHCEEYEAFAKQLEEADNLQRCFNTAALFLSYRPRSEPEIRQRLRRRGFTDATVDSTISKLKMMGLVDDTAFAQFWKEDREYEGTRTDQRPF